MDKADKPVRLWWTLMLLGIALVVDPFLLGLPFLGVLLCFLLLLIHGVRTIYRLIKGRPVGRVLALSGASILALGLIILLFRFSMGLGESGSREVIRAVQAYRDVRGTYPAELAELVPEYIQNLPRSSLRWQDPGFLYRSPREGGEGPFLEWVVLPPFGIRSYDFSTGETTSRD